MISHFKIKLGLFKEKSKEFFSEKKRKIFLGILLAFLAILSGVLWVSKDTRFSIGKKVAGDLTVISTPTTKVLKIKILKVDLADATNSCTQDQIYASVFGSINSIKVVYEESSRGAVTINGDVSSVNLNLTKKGIRAYCGVDTRAKLATLINSTAGIDLNNFDKVIYILPYGSCSWGGNFDPGGQRLWWAKCEQPKILAHEIGHTFGMYHAATETDEYGDYSDPLGGGADAPLSQFNAPHLVQMGWLPSSSIKEVASSADYSLSCTEENVVFQPQVLVLSKPDTGEKYYVSFRCGIGIDTNLDPKYRDNFLTVHRANFDSKSPKKIYLLSLLPVGDSFVDAANKISIKLNSCDNHIAKVNIVFEGSSLALTSAPTTTSSSKNPPPYYGYLTFKRPSELPLTDLGMYTNFTVANHNKTNGTPNEIDFQALRNAKVKVLLKLDRSLVEDSFLSNGSVNKTELTKYKALMDSYKDVIDAIYVIDEPYKESKNYSEQQLHDLVEQVKRVFPEYKIYVNFLSPVAVNTQRGGSYPNNIVYPHIPENIDLLSFDTYYKPTSTEEMVYKKKIAKDIAILRQKSDGQPIIFASLAFRSDDNKDGIPDSKPELYQADWDYEIFKEQNLGGLGWYFYDETNANKFGSSYWPDLIAKHKEIGQKIFGLSLTSTPVPTLLPTATLIPNLTVTPTLKPAPTSTPTIAPSQLTPTPTPMPIVEQLTAQEVVLQSWFKFNRLRVAVSSSFSPNVTLSVVGYGDLKYSRKDRNYTNKFWTFNKWPQTVTIVSSGGGQILAPVIWQ